MNPMERSVAVSASTSTSSFVEDASPTLDDLRGDMKVTAKAEEAAPVDTVIASAGSSTPRCLRHLGVVCVCVTCEETRTRLLHRKRSRGVNEEETEATSTVSVATSKTTATSTALVKQQEDKDKLIRMSEACRTILECIGEDPSRSGLLKTPERWAKSLLFMTSGYALVPDQVTNGAVFEENHDEMVVVRNIDIHSLCEHHMVPFTGKVHIGYIPNGKILGLSKLARISELYARRLQVQERLTRQIADAVVETVEPLGVAVVVECTHFCMVMRGVQKTAAVTTTSSVRGCFESNPKTRAEFFSIIHGHGIKMC